MILTFFLIVWDNLGDNILTGEDVKKIAFKAPTTLHKRFTLGILGEENLGEYGARIVKLILTYVENEGLDRHLVRKRQRTGNSTFISNSTYDISDFISDSEDGDDEESQSTTDADQFGYVSGVIVSRTGSEVVDGTYERDVIFEGAYRFSKLGSDCKYSIFKCTYEVGLQYWYIYHIPHGCIPGTTMEY
jgi:hypothetical protein